MTGSVTIPLCLPGEVRWCHLCKRIPEVSRLCAEMQRQSIRSSVGPDVQWKDEGLVFGTKAQSPAHHWLFQ